MAMRLRSVRSAMRARAKNEYKGASWSEVTNQTADKGCTRSEGPHDSEHREDLPGTKQAQDLAGYCNPVKL